MALTDIERRALTVTIAALPENIKSTQVGLLMFLLGAQATEEAKHEVIASFIRSHKNNTLAWIEQQEAAQRRYVRRQKARQSAFHDGLIDHHQMFQHQQMMQQNMINEQNRMFMEQMNRDSMNAINTMNQINNQTIMNQMMGM